MLRFAVTLQMLFVNVIRDHPGWILHFRGHTERTDWSFPVESAEADRERINHFRRGAGTFDVMLMLRRWLGIGCWFFFRRRLHIAFVGSLDNGNFLERRRANP